MPTKPADVTPDAAPEGAPEQHIVQLRYVVLHDGLDSWSRGQALTEAQLAGIDIDRLLQLGALAIHQE